MKKFELMSSNDIKEIESLMPNHRKALVNFGAEMYKKGIIKGSIITSVGTCFGVMVVSPIMDVMTEKIKERCKKNK